MESEAVRHPRRQPQPALALGSFTNRDTSNRSFRSPPLGVPGLVMMSPGKTDLVVTGMRRES